MIFICLNFIFLYTGPKSVESCWTPEHISAACLDGFYTSFYSPCGFIQAREREREKRQQNKAKQRSYSSQETGVRSTLCDNCVSLRGHVRQIRTSVYYVYGGKRDSNLCTRGASAPLILSFHTPLHLEPPSSYTSTLQIKNSSAGFYFVLTQT